MWREDEFDDFDLFDNLGDEPSGRSREIVDHRTQEMSYDVVSDDNKIMFCKQASRYFSDREQFVGMLDFFAFINNNKLAKQCRLSQAKIDDYWGLVVQYSEMSDQEIRSDARTYRKFRDDNAVHALSNSLWNEGLGPLDLGTSVVVPTSVTNEVVLNVLDDKEKLVNDAIALKYQDLKPAVNAILSCIPGDETRKLVTDKQKREFVFSMVEDFQKGNDFSVDFDQSLLGTLTQPGGALPHTYPVTEWIAESVSNVLREQFDAKALIMFRSKNQADGRQYDSSRDKYVITSDNPDDPFFWDCNPSFFCKGFQTVDQRDVWKWRALQKVIQAEVTASCQTKVDDSASFREEERIRISRRYANDFVPQDFPSIRWMKGMGCLARLSPEWTKMLGGPNLAIKCYKRGYSSLKEVEDNVDYLHVVSYANGTSLGDKKYFRIELPDLASVLLIPHPLWAKSKFMKYKTSSRDANLKYSSAFGMEKREGVNPYMAFFLFFSLGSIMQMFGSWKSGSTFSYKNYVKQIVGNVKAPGKYVNLLRKNKRNLDTKLRVVSAMVKTFPGPIVGLVISPSSTKFGRSAVNHYTKNSGYDRQFSYYEGSSIQDITNYTDSDQFGEFDVQDNYDDVTDSYEYNQDDSSFGTDKDELQREHIPDKSLDQFGDYEHYET